MYDKRRCWAEIDLNQLRCNLECYTNSILTPTRIMAVVKADAYGHGDSTVANYLDKLGVTFFAVSNIDEAIRIREAGVQGFILILGYTPLERAIDLVKYNIIQTLLSEEYAEHLSSTGFPIKCHFAIDTGMRRIGLNADDIVQCEKAIRRKYDNLEIIGIFTHLCAADSSNKEDFDFTKDQIRKFETVAKCVEDLKLPHVHCLNSAGGLKYHTSFSSYIRLGIILPSAFSVKFIRRKQ